MAILRNAKSRWHVVVDRADGTMDCLTAPMMSDGERDWGDLPEAACFASHERAKEEAYNHGGRPVPA